MSDTETETAPSELSLLKDRARLMGVSFSNNISVETLKQKIAAKMDADTNSATSQSPVFDATAAAIVAKTDPVQQAAGAADPVKPISLRQYLHDREMKLVRIRLTCLDDKKRNLPGEIFTVANEYLGTVRRFVPFGEKTDAGWHVPVCILNVLKTRKFLQIKINKNTRGQEQVSTRWVREFAIEELDPLTPAELANLARTQEAAGLFNDEE